MVSSISLGDREVEMKRSFIFSVFIFLALNLFNAVFAEDIKFEITVDRNKVSLGESFQMSFTFYNIQNVPAFEFPEVEEFESNYLGPFKRMSVVNGKVTNYAAHNYRLSPLKKGVFTIGPFSGEYKGQVYSSNSIKIEVVDALGGGKGQGQEPDGGQVELRDKVFLVMKPEKTKVYLNEIVPLTIKLYVNTFDVRDVQYPRFVHEGFSVGEYEKANQYKEVLDGVLYNVIEFKTNIFGTRSGRFLLGPAQVECNIILKKKSESKRRSPLNDFFREDLFEDLFGRYERYPLDLKSEESEMTVLSLPDEGKPGSFSGAVGSFDFVLKADPKEVKVGDPITLKMVMSGKGNFSTVNAPKIDIEEYFKIYEPQVKAEGNVKTFEQILMPKTDNIKEIPKIEFSFFNPDREEYKSIVKGPTAVRVLPSEDESLTIIEGANMSSEMLKKEDIGRGIIYIKPSPGKLRAKHTYLYKSKTFFLFQIFPIIALIILLTVYRRVERIKTDVKYARHLRAPAKAKKGLKKSKESLQEYKTEEFYNNVFKTLQEYLGDKFHIPVGGITIDVVDGVLKSKGVEENILNKLKDIFRECDTARYAPSEFGKDKMEETIKGMEEVIDYFQRKRI